MEWQPFSTGNAKLQIEKTPATYTNALEDKLRRNFGAGQKDA